MLVRLSPHSFSFSKMTLGLLLAVGMGATPAWAVDNHNGPTPTAPSIEPERDPETNIAIPLVQVPQVAPTTTQEPAPYLASEAIPLLQDEVFRKWLRDQNVQLPPKDQPLSDEMARQIGKLLTSWAVKNQYMGWVDRLKGTSPSAPPPINAAHFLRSDRLPIMLDNEFLILPRESGDLPEVIDRAEWARREEKFRKVFSDLGFELPTESSPLKVTTKKIDFRPLLKTPEGKAQLKLAGLDGMAESHGPVEIFDSQIAVPLEPGLFEIADTKEFQEFLQMSKDIIAEAGIEFLPSGEIKIDDTKKEALVEALLDPESDLNGALKSRGLGVGNVILAGLLNSSAFANFKGESSPALISKTISGPVPPEFAGKVAAAQQAMNHWDETAAAARKIAAGLPRYSSWESAEMTRRRDALKAADARNREAVEPAMFHLTELAKTGFLPDEVMAHVPKFLDEDLRKIATIAQAKRNLVATTTVNIPRLALAEAESLILDKMARQLTITRIGRIAYDPNPEQPHSQSISQIASRTRYQEYEPLFHEVNGPKTTQNETTLSSRDRAERVQARFNQAMKFYIEACEERFSPGGFLGAGNWVATQTWAQIGVGAGEEIQKNYDARLEGLKNAALQTREISRTDPRFESMAQDHFNNYVQVARDCMDNGIEIAKGLRRRSLVTGAVGIVTVATWGLATPAAAGAAGMTGTSATVLGLTRFGLGASAGMGAYSGDFLLKKHLDGDKAEFSKTQLVTSGAIGGTIGLFAPSFPKATALLGKLGSYGGTAVMTNLVIDGAEGKGWKPGAMTSAFIGTVLAPKIANRLAAQPKTAPAKPASPAATSNANAAAATTDFTPPPLDPAKAAQFAAAGQRALQNSQTVQAGVGPAFTGPGLPPTLHPTGYRYSPAWLKSLWDKKLTSKLRVYNDDIDAPNYRQKHDEYLEQLNRAAKLPSEGNEDPRAALHNLENPIPPVAPTPTPLPGPRTVVSPDRQAVLSGIGQKTQVPQSGSQAAAAANAKPVVPPTAPVVPALVPPTTPTEKLAFLHAFQKVLGSKGYIRSFVEDRIPLIHRLLAIVTLGRNSKKLTRKELDVLGKDLWTKVLADDMDGAYATMNKQFAEKLSYDQFSKIWSRIRNTTVAVGAAAAASGVVRFTMKKNDAVEEIKSLLEQVGPANQVSEEVQEAKMQVIHDLIDSEDSSETAIPVGNILVETASP